MAASASFASTSNKKKRYAWVRAINRKDWIPTVHSYICSEHFVDGWHSDDASDANYIPTIFKYKVALIPPLALAGKARAEARSDTKEFVFKEKEGDLFNCPPSWSLAHCISVDAHMGKGIATIFKKNFEGVDEIKRQGSEIGGCAVLQRDERFIYYLTTKARYFEKPRYESLHSSLETMKKHCIENEVKYVAMPMIGCGLDGLSWPRVKVMIHAVFKDTTLTITVYKLGKRAPSNKRACFSKPTMENSYRKLVS